MSKRKTYLRNRIEQTKLDNAHLNLESTTRFELPQNGKVHRATSDKDLVC